MPDANDTLINLSFSMHSGPGTYALLLGSGISQGAGIPTGWDIVLDLIRKLGTLEGEPAIDNPEQWFKDKYHEEPKYSSLVDRVAPSQTDRRNLLKKYIEPTEEEREQGLKVPSQSHKAIAQLVKSGIVHLIITTNIDQLLETSLKKIGITPVVIFNDDSLEGAIPYVHSECTLIKLHGDYLDTRIKNTPDELAQYSERMNSCLDRIFDEFGLVICGWSANWDTALRDALYRRNNRRFSTYWMYPRELSSEASGLNDHLRGIPFQFENADKFFLKVSENIDALRTFERPHPLSVPLAIAQVKKYVAEDKYYIVLHDFLQEDTNRLCSQLPADRFKTSGLQIPRDQSKAFFQSRMHQYEELIKPSIGIYSTYVYFGARRPTQPVVSLVDRLLEIPYTSGDSRLVNLQYYPAYVLNYAIGVSALSAENYPALYSLLVKPRLLGNGRPQTSLEALTVWRIFDHDADRLVPSPREDIRYYTPVSDYLCKFLREELRYLIPDVKKFEVTFDLFEYISGLTYVDQQFPDLTSDRIHGTIGRFKWKYRLYGLAEGQSPIEEFFQNGISRGNNWSLLQAGFFSGSVERLRACKTAYDAYLNTVGQHWL